MSERPLRIAMIGPFGLAPKGTLRARALPLARALAARGHAACVLMPPWHTRESPRTWVEDGVTLEYVALGPPLPGLSYLAITGRLVRAALAWRPDVIHCFKPKAYAGLAGWALWHLQRLGLDRFRLVMDEDDWEGPGGWNDLEGYPRPLRAFFAWQERWGLRHADAVTLASRTLESLAWATGASQATSYYLPNGGHPARLGDGASVRARLGLGQRPVILLYTRFFEFDVARPLDVLRSVLVETPEACLLVVGKALFTADDARFDRLVAESGLSGSVVRTGWVEPEALSDHFAAADVALYPLDDTLVNRAKGVAKLVELLSSGVPVVADAVGQASESIRQDETGLLVPPGDAAAMALGIVRLLQHPELRRAMGINSVEYMRATFGWDVLAETVLAAYGAPSPSSRA
jgi:glycosyltransferase involved in cell wall biosynthesis